MESAPSTKRRKSMRLKNKKNKRGSAFFWALMLSLSMAISGCGGQGGASSGTGASESVSATGESSSAVGSESTGETGGTEENKEILPEAAQLSANLGAVFQDFQATKEQFGGQVLEFQGKALGGMLPTVDFGEPEIYSKDKIAEVNRTMRAYEKGVEDLIVNNAKEFYVYGLLNDEQKTMYDAYYLLAQDPTTQDNIVSFQTAQNVQSEEFVDDLYMSLLAVCYDHPELWWLYPWNGTAEVGWGVGDTVNGKTTMYTGFIKTYPNFEKDVKAFNAAVESFLADIDETADEEEIALQIHDKLIQMVTYDNAILQEGKNDFGHTAFGPFVTNSDGTPHYCVCDGYSQAYLYALQQMGITGLVVVGNAGNAGVDGGMGLHAWNLVMLGGKWYEVDTTWDDFTNLEDQIKEGYAAGSDEYKYLMEAASDKIFMNHVLHNMYRLTTAAIQNFEPGPELYYTSRDGRMRFSVVGASQRWRVCDDKDMGSNFEGDYTRLLPIADGRLAENSSGSNTTQSSDSQGNETSQSSSDTQTEEDVWEGGNGDILDLIAAETYKQITGTWYVSAFNNYTEAVLKQYYGNEYYKQLSMFELRKDGSGTLYENGSSLEFNYYFDGSLMYMYSANGGMLFLAYNNGNFYMSDYYGNVYTFSKL